MLKKTLAALVLTSSLAACHDRAPQVIAMPANPVDISRPGNMTVNGQATLEVSPDCADMTITIGADAQKPGSAAKQLEAKKQAMIEAMKKLGVETNDVKISNLTLDPVFHMTGQGWTTNKVDSYRAVITVTATTKDFSKIPEMLDAASSAGASAISTQFRRSDLAELKKKVRDMALKAAKEKAAQTAGTLGIRLGRIVSVAENQAGYMWSQTYFPQVANAMDTQVNSTVVLGGSLQPLTLDVTIAYELATQT